MNSLRCALDGSVRATAAALEEAECFAQRCALSEKQGLQLRLLAEELLGMASGVLDLQDGTFWMEQEEGTYQLHLTAHATVGEAARSKLLNASSTGKNDLHQGVTGKIRQAMEWLLNAYPAGTVSPFGVYNGMMLTLNDTLGQEWSLECYRQSLSRTEKAQAWDELEKSVLGKLADDVRVGVDANRIHLIIKKAFSQ